jgi:hypothetical protein
MKTTSAKDSSSTRTGAKPFVSEIDAMKVRLKDHAIGAQLLDGVTNFISRPCTSGNDVDAKKRNRPGFPDQAGAFFIDLRGKCASGTVIAKMHEIERIGNTISQLSGTDLSRRP